MEASKRPAEGSGGALRCSRIKRFNIDWNQLSRCSVRSLKTDLFDSDQGNLKAKPPHRWQGILLEGLSDLISHLSSITRHLLHLYSYLFICKYLSGKDSFLAIKVKIFSQKIILNKIPKEYQPVPPVHLPYPVFDRGWKTERPRWYTDVSVLAPDKEI